MKVVYFISVFIYFDLESFEYKADFKFCDESRAAEFERRSEILGYVLTSLLLAQTMPGI